MFIMKSAISDLVAKPASFDHQNFLLFLKTSSFNKFIKVGILSEMSLIFVL